MEAKLGQKWEYIEKICPKCKAFHNYSENCPISKKSPCDDYKTRVVPYLHELSAHFHSLGKLGRKLENWFFIIFTPNFAQILIFATAKVDYL